MLNSPEFEQKLPLRSHHGVDIPEYILVIANSGRMLAEGAAKSGIKALVIDLYGDADTRCSAVACIKIPALNPAYIAHALDYFIQKFSVKYAVYGSGFENHPESLYFLNERMIILGNSPEIFFRLQKKADLFSVLAGLNIAFPEVTFAPPVDGNKWLTKPMQGQGGIGIKRCKPDDGAESMVYWQRVQAGTAHSALFLADGQQAQVVGFNTQWTVRLSACQEFIFSGIMTDCDLSRELCSLVTDWIQHCVPVFGLKGLGSLDFISTGDHCLFLEINARPPASMQLYESLLNRHILAVQGVLTDNPPGRVGCSGMQVVYADHDLMIPAGFDWPDGCLDRPEAGVICRTGQPVCSIIARQNSSRQVLDQINQKRQQIVNQMIKV